MHPPFVVPYLGSILVQILPEGALNDPPAGSAETSEVRDFVPARGLGKPEARHAMIFGAYQSTEQQTDRPAWAWDPILYYLGSFDGAKMDLSNGNAQYVSISVLLACTYRRDRPPAVTSKTKHTVKFLPRNV
jgi:hypothetical protein